MSPKPTPQPKIENTVLVVDEANLPATAFALRDLLATSPNLFMRAVPVKLIVDSENGMPGLIFFRFEDGKAFDVDLVDYH